MNLPLPLCLCWHLSTQHRSLQVCVSVRVCVSEIELHASLQSRSIQYVHISHIQSMHVLCSQHECSPVRAAQVVKKKLESGFKARSNLMKIRAAFCAMKSVANYIAERLIGCVVLFSCKLVQYLQICAFHPVDVVFSMARLIPESHLETIKCNPTLAPLWPLLCLLPCPFWPLFERVYFLTT